MKMIYAVRDRAIDAFGQPIFCLAEGQAVRSFIDEVNSSQSSMHAHPEDYDLYFLGQFDDSSGELVPDKPKMVCIGKDVISSD